MREADHGKIGEVARAGAPAGHGPGPALTGVYAVCPACGHRPAAGALPADVCPACGIVFRKWLQRRLASANPAPHHDDATGPGIGTRLLQPLLYTEPAVGPVLFAGRAAVLAVLALWGWHFLRLDYVQDFGAVGRSILHLPNLVFHEAGHVLFRPFGWFMTILGGSLFQLLVPAFLAAMFLFRYHNPFAAAVCTWWLGQSSMDLAPYIDDALDQKMVLVGGRTGADAPGNHDWNNILGELDMLERHREFAGIADSGGKLLIVLAVAWGAVLLLRQYRRLGRF